MSSRNHDRFRNNNRKHLPNFKAHGKRRRVAARFSQNWNATVGDDGKIYRVCLLQIQTLRLLKIIPTWETFTDGPTWVDDIQEFLTGEERRRYQAVFELVALVTGRALETRLNNLKVLALITMTRQREVEVKFGAEYLGRYPVPVTPIMAGITVEFEVEIREEIKERYNDLFPWN